MSVVQRAGRALGHWIGQESAVVRAARLAYEAMLLWASGGRGIRWQINGETFRVDPRFRHRLGQDYDAPVADYIRRRLRPGAVCFDVGANVGVYVLQFARWTGAAGRVIAFEPNPAAVAVLRRHALWNTGDAPVTIVPEAVGAAEGHADLFVAAEDAMARLDAPNPLIASHAVPVRVPVCTIDRYSAREGVTPDWLFVDVEGFELAALEGARDVIDRGGDRLHIVVEMHPEIWEATGVRREDVEAFLGAIGRRAVPLMGQVDALAENGLVALEMRD